MGSFEGGSSDKIALASLVDPTAWDTCCSPRDVVPLRTNLLPRSHLMSTRRVTLTVASLAAAAAALSACGSSGSSPPPAAAPTSSAAKTSSPAKTPTSAATSTSSATSTASGSGSSSAAASASGTLDAANQTSDGKSVTVASVTLKAGGKGGWIALHTDVSGKPGPVKYFVAVPSGASNKVVIPTPEGIPTGDYWPMLHVDDHMVGTYEFPKIAGADLPAMSNGMVVMKKITVTVK